MLDIIVFLLIVALIATPLVILARSPRLEWDDPQGVPLPGAERHEIAEDLNVDLDDVPTDEEIEAELNGSN